jgi:hypothetical protein
MPHGGKDQRKPSDDAVLAAEAKSLGALVDTFPLQKKGLLSFRFRDTGHLVHRFERGFVDQPRAGGAPPVAMRYDQISWVRQSYLKHYLNHYYNKTSFAFRIGSLADEVVLWEGSFFDRSVHSGPTFSKGDPRLPRFVAKLAEGVSEARLPAHLKALDEGRSLTFGNIVISREGVRAQDGVVPWSQVEPLAFDRGVVVVNRRPRLEPVVRTSLGSIPNLPMFLTLFENLRRGRKT